MEIGALKMKLLPSQKLWVCIETRKECTKVQDKKHQLEIN